MQAVAPARTLNGLTIDDLTIGMSRKRTRCVTQADVESFGDLSGDRNPLHFDQDYAASTRFGGVVAHGMLSAAFFSGVIGEELPGPGAIYLSQTLRFCAPVRPGDTVEVRCEVAEIERERRRVTLNCTAIVGDKTVLEGEALIVAPRGAS